MTYGSLTRASAALLKGAWALLWRPLVRRRLFRKARSKWDGDLLPSLLNTPHLTQTTLSNVRMTEATTKSSHETLTCKREKRKMLYHILVSDHV